MAIETGPCPISPPVSRTRCPLPVLSQSFGPCSSAGASLPSSGSILPQKTPPCPDPCRCQGLQRRAGCATAGRARRSRWNSTLTASIRATSSSTVCGRPSARTWRASCSARDEQLSSPISRPDFIWALARAISASDHGCRRVIDDVAITARFRAPPATGADIEAEKPVSWKGRDEGINRITKAARLAHLLEQTRRHPAPESRCVKTVHENSDGSVAMKYQRSAYASDGPAQVRCTARTSPRPNVRDLTASAPLPAAPRTSPRLPRRRRVARRRRRPPPPCPARDTAAAL